MTTDIAADSVHNFIPKVACSEQLRRFDSRFWDRDWPAISVRGEQDKQALKLREGDGRAVAKLRGE